MTHVHQNEKESLLVAMKTTKTKRMYERYQTIYFYVQGFSIKEIMNMIGRSEKTIYNYVNAYNNICTSYNMMKQFNKAIESGQKGLALDPNNQLLKNNLKIALDGQKNAK